MNKKEQNMETLKDCLTKISSGEDVLKSINEQQKFLESLKFISAFHQLKEELANLFNNEKLKDHLCDIWFVENEKGYSVTAEIIHGCTDEDLESRGQQELSNEVALIDSNICNIAQTIQSTNKEHFGTNLNGLIILDFNSKFEPDLLTDFILGSSVKSVYRKTLFDIDLNQKVDNVSKRLKL